MTGETLIDKCGGFKAVATWLGVDRTTVLRWTWERPKGTGGVPAKYWATLLTEAKAHNVHIAIEDLIPPAAREAAVAKPKRKRAG